ncbi:mobilome CxxCx(11)CxxC protein [Shewanella vesiculosa]|uniref:Mobilome CxxCx(11)CxxC protein n=1 Tax=Shewanella vesiculosa TaxID=518738 RepID=A0ABV0FYQ5_9GAMM
MTDSIDKKDVLAEIKHLEFLSYGTAQIFEKRANSLKVLRAWLTFLGIVLPITVGGVYLSFSKSAELMEWTVTLAGIIGIFQLILSTWALVSGWDSKYESAIKSMQGNTTIYNRCKRFSNTPPNDDVELVKGYNQILNDAEMQELIDLAQHVSQKEKQYAYVSALGFYGGSCHACEQSPNKLNKATVCPSCGQKKVKLS